MLTHLHIRDFAIVDELELTLQSGMTALTGETGAGKSILLDALGLVLGDRADSTTVRTGCDRAEINAEFALATLSEVRGWLEDQELDGEDDHCLLRRVVGADGRSRAWINGRPTTLVLMRELGEQLVDIHGQHEHQSLRRRDAQRDLLDGYGDHSALLETCAAALHAWRDAQSRLATLGDSPEERAQRIEFLRYQVTELEALALEPDEPERLHGEHDRLANAGRILSGCETGLGLLYDEEHSVHTLLSRAATEIDSIAAHDAALGATRELIATAGIQVDEAVATLRDYRQRLDLDPARLEWLEQRLRAMHDLARKHHVDVADLTDLHQRLATELETLEQADAHSAEYEQAVADRLAEYRTCAERLTAARRDAGTRLAERVTAAMQELGMEGGSFAVEVASQPDAAPTAHGNDRVEFLVTTNPGQPPAALRRVASGGELSRISLAIQMITSHQAGIPTQIFDEVDAGIGGRTAATVGHHLGRLGETRQVLCVTHLAQVAAAAHHHLRISKSVRAGGEDVVSQLEPLDGDARIEEIARMIGGAEVTDRSRAHAREMLTGTAVGKTG